MRVLNPWILGAFVALSGCSLSLEFDCTEDGDCENLAGNFTCIGGACVEQAVDMAAADMMIQPDSTPEPEGFACADEQPLISNSCYDILGPLARSPGTSAAEREAEFLEFYQDYELIAVHVPNGGFEASGKGIIQAAVHDAIDHINENGGMTFGSDGASRRLAALICNDTTDVDPTAGVQSARHAVACGVRAIVGTYSSTLTVEIFREVAQDANIPVISPGAISPQIPEARQTLGDDEGLLWRIKVPGSTLIDGIVGLIDYMNYQNVHVFYRPSTQYDAAMRNRLDLALGGGNSTSHMLDTVAGSTAAAVTAIMEEADPQPDVVLTVVEDLGDLLEVAVGLIDAAPALAEPFDLISVEGARSAAAVDIIKGQRIGTPDPVLPVICRGMGISAGSKNGNTYSGWLTTFTANAGNYNINNVESRLVAPVPAYVDAIYVTGFAMASALRAGDGEFDTDGLLNGLRVLSDGAIEGNDRVRPNEWAKGLVGLGEDGETLINYDGASGTIDLNPATQDVDGNKIELWQYELGNVSGVNDVGDLVPDDGDPANPDPGVVQALRSNAGRPECAEFEYVGDPDRMP